MTSIEKFLIQSKFSSKMGYKYEYLIFYKLQIVQTTAKF